MIVRQKKRVSKRSGWARGKRESKVTEKGALQESKNLRHSASAGVVSQRLDEGGKTRESWGKKKNRKEKEDPQGVLRGYISTHLPLVCGLALETRTVLGRNSKGREETRSGKSTHLNVGE